MHREIGKRNGYNSFAKIFSYTAPSGSLQAIVYRDHDPMIFISYAKEDHGYASGLYIALAERGLDPWMDKPPPPYHNNGLRIGQRWRSVLEAKIQQASHIILILSPASIRKRGFVQTEFRMALGLMSQMPDDQVFVLPVLAQDCDVPSLRVGEIDLRDIQWEVVKEANLAEFAMSVASGMGK